MIVYVMSSFIFSWLKGDDNHYFKIDNSTGTIYVNSSIDRDQGIDYFELTVEVMYKLEKITLPTYNIRY